MKKTKNFKGIILILAVLWLLSFLISMLFSGNEAATGNVAIIPVKGLITGDESSGFMDGITSSSAVVDDIKKAAENKAVKAIVLEINSPGGSPVASDEIARAIQKANKPTASYIREVGASGAYWVATATDRIFANQLSVTGSIGVIASYLEFGGLLANYNITYQRLVAGKYKDAGVPFRKLSQLEEQMIQKRIDAIYDVFIKTVAKNRKMDEARVKEIATGEVFLGDEALELGLIDELGGQDEAKAYLEARLNITVKFFEYEKKHGLIEVLSKLFSRNSFYIGQGIGDALTSRAAEKSFPQILT